MAQGHDQRGWPDRETSETDRSTSRTATSWRGAVGRGIVLGIVLSLHLGLAARLLTWSPTPLRSSRHAGTLSRRNDEALQITFIRPRLLPLQPRAHSPSRHAAPHRRRIARRVGLQSVHVPSTPATTTVIPAPSIAAPTTPANPRLTYRPGNFAQELQAARHREPLIRLPGMDDAPPSPGLQLRAPAPSFKQVVHAIGRAQDCYAEQQDMRHQGNDSAPQIDRLLEADGCGPHQSPDGNSAAVHAAVQAVMRGD
ncbi:hypothetical protein [Dyella sp. A6]|uniref:hypothetical protein n=1 Tax=Dyella aluminiiresistens TaxID=3069105 RepID=UPI002E7802EC|nr:hypothetical protein [Dyella sp. A6]